MIGQTSEDARRALRQWGATAAAPNAQPIAPDSMWLEGCVPEDGEVELAINMHTGHCLAWMPADLPASFDAANAAAAASSTTAAMMLLGAHVPGTYKLGAFYPFGDPDTILHRAPDVVGWIKLQSD